jgi:hypothetical protein
VSIDPKSVVSAIESSTSPVRLSELNDLYARHATSQPASADITSGLAAAIRNGWVHTDGLRVFVSGSGKQILDH